MGKIITVDFRQPRRVVTSCSSRKSVPATAACETADERIERLIREVAAHWTPLAIMQRAQAGRA